LPARTRVPAASILAAASVLAAVAGPGRRVRGDEPVTSDVRYTREVVRILQRRCLACHAPDGIAMPLAQYHEVRAWGRAVREEIVEERMPPWSAASGFGRFRNDLSLTAREEATLLSWIDGGMPRGDLRDLPPAPSARPAAPPDRRLAVPPQPVAAGAPVAVRRVTLETSLATDRWVRRVSIRPGDRRVLRGALVFAADGARGAGTAARPGQWLGAWTPWQEDLAPPEPHAFRLRARARLTLVLHYSGADEPVTDRTVVELYFADGGPLAVDEVALEDGPPDPRGVSTADVVLARDAHVWALQFTPAAATASLELRARRPDGSIEVLLWVPRPRPEWPQALVLETRSPLPAGTVLSMVTHAAAAGHRRGGAAARAVVSLLRPPATPPRP